MIETTESTTELLENIKNNCVINSDLKNQSNEIVNKIDELVVIEDENVPSTSSSEACMFNLINFKFF